MNRAELFRGRASWLLAIAFFASSLTGCSLNSSSSGGEGGGGSGPHTVSLTWEAGTSANVVGYNVYRATVAGSYGLLSSMNSGTSYTDTTVENGQTYFYVVTAVDSTGTESPYSNVAEAVIP
jgi:TolB protein